MTLPQPFLFQSCCWSSNRSLWCPTHFCTECGVDQTSLLLHTGHGSVSYTLATLLYFSLARPTLQGSCSGEIREDAGRPVPIGLGQKLITWTRFRLFQYHVQAMVLLSTATWAEYKQKMSLDVTCSSSTHSTWFLFLFSNFNYFWLVCQK